MKNKMGCSKIFELVIIVVLSFFLVEAGLSSNSNEKYAIKDANEHIIDPNGWFYFFKF
jgi:hypothetical protein